MQTVYIDVYFLINFSLNVISLYFAVMLAHADSSSPRILTTGCILSLLSVLYLFLPEGHAISLSLSVLVGMIIIFFSVRRASIRRRISVLASFFIVELIFGGAVNYFYSVLERLVKGYTVGEYEYTNGGILLLALFVLLSVGIIRLFILMFRARFDKSIVKIAIIHKEKRIMLDALVDSGNLLRDPFDSSAVLLIKEGGFFCAYPSLADKEGEDLVSCGTALGINLHPISIRSGAGTRLLWAFKPDHVEIITEKGTERIAITVALDKEGGDYGGCEALLPVSVLSNAA